MATFMITQVDFLKHNNPKQPPIQHKPLSGMHLGMNKGLEDDNPNIFIAKWILVHTIVSSI